MKKKIIILILSIVLCCCIYLNRLNSPVKITEEMLEEETEMESEEDKKQLSDTFKLINLSYLFLMMPMILL